MYARKHTTRWFGMLGMLALAGAAFASEAETSATASGGRYGSSGTVAGTARYVGDVGFARTDTRTGILNAARSVAVGVDRDGLSVSVSTALAAPNGQALGATFNFALDRQGESAYSVGRVNATGGRAQTATVGGSVFTARTPVARALAGGRTDGGGVVAAHTVSGQRPVREVVRVIQPVRRVIHRR